MNCYEADLKAEFTGILCTMALNMSRHLSVARQNKVLLLPELKKVVRNLICCECDSSVEQFTSSKNQQTLSKLQPKPRSKQQPRKKVPATNRVKLDPRGEESVTTCPHRKFVPPERISVKIKNLRHVKQQSSTILTKRRISTHRPCKGMGKPKNSTYVYRQEMNMTSETDV